MKLFIALLLLASTQAFLLKDKLGAKTSVKPCTSKDGKFVKVNSLDITSEKNGMQYKYVMQAKALKAFNMYSYVDKLTKNGKLIFDMDAENKLNLKSGQEFKIEWENDVEKKEKGMGMIDEVFSFYATGNDAPVDCFKFKLKI